VRGDVSTPAYRTPAAVDRLPPAYRDLFERAAEVLIADERVRGMWLGGSLARGTADAASDLDVFVAVTDEHLPAFAEGWRDLLASITPTVLAEEQWFAKGSFWSVTPGFERFDVVVEPASAIPTTLFPVRVAVFDHDDLSARLPAERDRALSAATVATLVEDWFHFSAMLEVLLVREDWLLAAEHLHLLRDLLYKLFVEGNQPLPATGLKRWSEKLTPGQREVLASLPTSAASRPEVVDAHLGLARAFLGAARPLARRLDVDWPAALEEAATRHLRTVLDVPDPYPA
jgi:predicted nucleotidyltransferase